MRADNQCVLEMRSITKSFPGVRALDGVNLSVRSGRVHVICGENGAGKSTLMKIINGTYDTDFGEMFFEGKLIGKHTVQDTMNMGIAMIYQEMNPVMDLTVAENVYLGREPTIGSFVDFRKLYRDTQAVLDDLRAPYNARQRMRELSIAGQQLVEIAKAISMNSKVIIMDEPSSAIADYEVEILFEHIFALRDQNVAILYITHKMDEIFRIADEITVIRDGKLVETGPVENYTADKLVSLMVGREITNIFPPRQGDIAKDGIALEVRNLTQSKEHGGRFRNISFQVRKGEILGFSGLVGAGRSELMRAIFGLDPFTSGELFIDGEQVVIRDTCDAIRAGVAMVSEDRRAFGLVLGMDVKENISLATLKQFEKKYLLNDKEIVKRSCEMVELLNIKIAGLDISVSTLSGGNQQKVVLAKWLIGDVKVMILDEPTRGIDVGAKSEIHRLMRSFTRDGMAVIMISSELPEILGMSDRVAVMSGGSITGILDRTEATQERIMKLAVGSEVK